MNTLYKNDFTETDSMELMSLKDSSYYCLEYAPEATFLIDQEFQVFAANVTGVQSIRIGSILIVQRHIIFQDKLSLETIEEAMLRLLNNESNYERCILKINGYCVACVLYPASNDRSKYLFAIKSQSIEEIVSGLPEVTRVFSLTVTETRILENMIQGMRPKEIALVQGNSLNTVRAHLRTIYAKMQVRSYNEALSKAIALLC